MKTVTSLANDTVKQVRALHLRKAREESGLFLAEGLKIVTEAVDLGFAPAILMFAGKSAGHSALERAAARAREVIEVTPAILEKISRRENPQTVLGVFEQRFTPLVEMPREGVLVALEQVRDPGNLGTIIRTCDAAGVGGLILIGETCDPYSVEAVRATMGSIFAVKIARATADEFLAWRAGWPGSVVGTLLTATTDFRAADYRRPSLLLLGNEQAGLTAELAAACDVSVKIPMRGRADSLNLSVAAGVMIYAATAATP
ncbi:MAG: RNA methyltransferase [Caulobacteraceae bacterium]